MKKAVLTLMAALVILAPVQAAEGKLEGVLLAQYMNIPASGANAFSVTRAYLTYWAELASNVKLRYTLDVAADPGVTAGSLDYFSKYAWLEVTKVIPAGARLRFGLIENPWIGFEEGIWGYRVQGSVFPDRIGVISSADFGLSLDGKLPGDILEYFATVTNGDGYKTTESDRAKRAELRLTGRPIKNVLVSGFVSKDYWSDDPSKPRDRTIGQVAYKDGNYTLAGDYLVANGSTAAGKVGSGYSIFGTAKLDTIFNALSGYTVIGRLDQWDPDTATASDATTRYIAGVSYELIKGTLILLDVDRLRTESGAGNSTSAYAHVQVKF
jgi:hypothetical protein